MLMYNLHGRLPGEKIIKVIRKDLFILFKKIILTVFLIIFPGLAGLMLINLYPSLLDGPVSFPLIILAMSGYSLFVCLFFFFSFIDYYLDIWVITDERIIDVRQEGFFSRVVAELKLSQIQDITSELHGFFQFIFKYGNVHVQTAGKAPRFVFNEISHPEKIRDIIIKLIEENKAHHKLSSA